MLLNTNASISACEKKLGRACGTLAKKLIGTQVSRLRNAYEKKHWDAGVSPAECLRKKITGTQVSRLRKNTREINRNRDGRVPTDRLRKKKHWDANGSPAERNAYKKSPTQKRSAEIFLCTSQ